MSKDFKLKTINPATGKNIKHYDPMSDSEMNKAIDACHKAFSDWKLMPTVDRAKIIKNIGKKLAEHKDELAKLMTQEMGKLEKEQNQKLIFVQQYATILLKLVQRVLKTRKEYYQKEAKDLLLILPLGVNFTEYSHGISLLTGSEIFYC